MNKKTIKAPQWFIEGMDKCQQWQKEINEEFDIDTESIAGLTRKQKEVLAEQENSKLCEALAKNNRPNILVARLNNYAQYLYTELKIELGEFDVDEIEYNPHTRELTFDYTFSTKLKELGNQLKDVFKDLFKKEE